MRMIHAPQALGGLDITQPGVFLRQDYFDLLAWLRANDPVHRSGDGAWLVTRYEDNRQITRQPRGMQTRRGVLVNDPLRDREPDDSAGSLLHLDPPVHAEYRSLLKRRFTPRAVARMEEGVRAVVDEVLDTAGRADRIDLVESLAAPIPVAVIADLLGITDVDHDTFRRWSDAVIDVSDRPDDEAIVRSAGELFAYLDDHVRQRMARPTDDLISVLVQAEVGGAPLTAAQLLMFCLTLLVAGNETTRSLLSGALMALAEHPEQRSLLAADEASLAGAVEESLRWVTPIQAFCRSTTTEVELGGRTLERGAYVVMLYASGNRDEAVFGPTADRFDITRAVSPPHVAFGFGEHLCLGAALARLEARVVLEQVLARFPDYRLAGPASYAPSTLTRSIASLPVVLSGRA